MDLIAVLAAFPIGWMVRHRLTAFVAYLGAYNLLFTFQSVVLLTEWAGGDQSAFGHFPKANSGDALGYGIVNLGFFVAGIVVLVAGRYVGDRLRGRRSDPALAGRATA